MAGSFPWHATAATEDVCSTYPSDADNSGRDCNSLIAEAEIAKSQPRLAKSPLLLTASPSVLNSQPLP